MKLLWNRLADAVDGLALHWRIMIFMALAGALVWGVMKFGFTPLLEQQRNLTRQQEALTAQATQANAQDDGRKALIAEISQLKLELAKRQPDAATRGNQTVSGQEMLQVLDRLLSQSRGLTLVNLKMEKTAPPALPLCANELPASAAASSPAAAAPVAASAPAAANNPPAPTKEYVSITVRGSYFDLLDYLERAERLPYPLHWASLDYDAKQYPVGTLTLTLYTQGDGSWLAI